MVVWCDIHTYASNHLLQASTESFPAATTIRMPEVTAALTAALSASDFSPPRDMLPIAFRPEVRASVTILLRVMDERRNEMRSDESKVCGAHHVPLSIYPLLTN